MLCVARSWPVAFSAQCLLPWQLSPRSMMAWRRGLCRVRGPVPYWTFILDCRDSAHCLLLPGQDAGRGSGHDAERIAQGWGRRARESPGKMSESDRTQLSQDPGGGTLAIDTLPDNGTRVVVSAGGTWKGREVVVRDSPGALCKLVGPANHIPFGTGLGCQLGERDPRGGAESRAQPGTLNFHSSELCRSPTSCTQGGEATCSRVHSMCTGFLTVGSCQAE